MKNKILIIMVLVLLVTAIAISATDIIVQAGNITIGDKVHSNDWTNVTIMESQISDSTHWWNISGADIYPAFSFYQFGLGGETFPEDPLHIKADSGDDVIRLEENSGTEYYQIEVDADGDLQFKRDQGQVTLMMADNDSWVGINTVDSPQGPLHVKADTNERTLVLEESSGGEKWSFLIESTGDLEIQDNLGNKPLVVGDSTLHVGIGGETSPADPLHVLGDSGNDAIRMEEFSGSEYWTMGIDPDGSLLFEDTGIIRFHIQDLTGNVGLIGCNDSDHDLKVGGTGLNCDTGTWSEMNAGEETFTISSDRDKKENIVQVDGSGVLDVFNTVRVYTYDFTEASCGTDEVDEDGNLTGVRDRTGCLNKFGLMADEFYDNFNQYTQRGDNESISGQDTKYVMWLAIQELIDKNTQLESDVSDLKNALCAHYPGDEICS